MRHENVWELYESGQLDMVIESLEDVESLDMIHTAMFENAMDVGVPRQKLSQKMEDINFEMARKHMLDDRDIAFLTRRSMEQFDRNVAIDILRSQIRGIVQLIDEHRTAGGP